MSDAKLGQMPLRDLFTGTERLMRELIEHLEQSQSPKLAELESLTQGYGSKEGRDAIKDVAIRQQAAAVLASDTFSQELLKKLLKHLAMIERDSSQALGG